MRTILEGKHEKYAFVSIFSPEKLSVRKKNPNFEHNSAFAQGWPEETKITKNRNTTFYEEKGIEKKHQVHDQ